tara:strand:+ start:1676 stop:3352 length:1677 start_codon:yes stop_codon:yes gene_type:complete
MILSKEKLSTLHSLYSQRQFEQVIQQGDDLIKEFSQDNNLLNILAASNIGLGRFNIAIEHYKKAIDLKPMDAEAYNNIGVAYKEKGDISRAIKNYQQAVNLNPSYVAAHINLGTALQENHNYKTAIEVFKRVIELTPDNERAYNNLGACYRAENQRAAAKDSYQLAIKHSKDYTLAYNNLGVLLYEEGDFEGAIEIYNQALQINPNDPHIHANLGKILSTKNQSAEAIESYQRAIKLKPDVASWFYSLGVIYSENEDTESALKYLHHALKVDPNLSTINHAIGLVYYQLKKYDDALAAFDKSGSPSSYAQSLLCLYAQGKYNEFKERIESNLDKYKNNIEVAAISAFTFNQINEENIHPFCKNPLDFICFSELGRHEENTPLLIDNLLEELKKMEVVWSQRKKSSHNGFHTTGNLFDNSHGVILDLEKIIKNEIEIYYEKYKSNSCGFINNWPENISLYGWSIRNLKDGFQRPHIHPTGWLSGVLYLQLVESENKDEGAIEWSLRGTNYVLINENIPKVRHHPKPGDLVLFPSSLYHYTIPIKNDGERVVISFDLLPN